jgi:hypothetical protein
MDPAGEGVYRELLTFDMYLRENLKSRPGFSGEISAEDKAVIRDIYREEEEKRVLLPGYEAYDWKQLSKMTHVEPFQYPVWDGEAMGSLTCVAEVARFTDEGKRYYLLFDYANRNPLTYEARVLVL